MMKTISIISRLAAIALPAMSACLMQSCLISNDMSYPKVKTEILAFEVEGQKSVEINYEKRQVNLVLEETADISNLNVTAFAITDGAECRPSIGLGSVLDLSEPMSVTLHLYRDYEWTISAVQPIERYVTVTGQIGSASIDESKKYVRVNVSSVQSLDKIEVTGMKLEPVGSTILGYVAAEGEEGAGENGLVPVTGFPFTLDCTLRRYFDIEYGGETIRWTLNVVAQDVELSVSSVNPWCYHADVSAAFDGVGEPYLEYRKASVEDWTAVRDVTVEGVSVSGVLPDLTEGTDYSVRLVRDGSYSDEVQFRTGTPDQISNFNFEDWYTYEGVVYPVSHENFESKVWDSANEGVASFLKKNPTMPSSELLATPQSHFSAKMTNMYAVIKFAAGNILTGDYVGLSGISGAKLDWGTPFTGRPKALKGYFSYQPGMLNYINNKKTASTELDKCQILVMLTDWDEPFHVNTAEGQFVDQENDPHIIAYGKLETDENTGNTFKEFTIDLDYRRPDATPRYAVVIACASYKGDEFTGSTESVMCVDEFEFVYD